MKRAGLRADRTGRGSRIAAGIALAVLLLSLVPLLWASLYAHPAADDFSYAFNVHRALEAGGGLLDVLRSAAAQVKTSYFSWQGTFAALFLFALMPATLSENLYFLTTFVLIGSLVLSTFYLADALVVRWLRGRRSWAVLLTSVLLIAEIQFVPYKADTFYWYNGAMFYTFFFALSLFLYGMLIRIALDGRARPVRLACALLLAVLIGGGNYSTVLLSLELLALLLFALIRRRKPAWGQVLAIALAMLAAFAVSAAAPGNAVRAAASRQLSPPVAILRSVVKMMQRVGNWTSLPQAVLLAFAAPFLYFLSLKCDWRFRWPLGACALALLLCASQMTPPFFATAGQGSERQVDIYYYTYYLALLFCEFYLCGWLARQNLIDAARARAACARFFVPGCLLLALLFGMGCCGQVWSMSSVEIGAGLLRGEPQRFDAAYMEWRARAAAGEAEAAVPDIDVPDYFRSPWKWDDPEYPFNGYSLEFYGDSGV